MKVKVLDRTGVWATGDGWSFHYWPPRTWLPLWARDGKWRARRGWWGAATFRRGLP